MTITRNELELAALAAGIKPDRSKKGGAPSGSDGFDVTGALVVDWHNGITWRPHIDPGDALKLAAAIGMKITAPKHRGDGASAEPLDGLSRSATVYREDKTAQMCVAITRCAAAVGERLQLAQRANATPGKVAASLAALDEYYAPKRG